MYDFAPIDARNHTSVCTKMRFKGRENFLQYVVGARLCMYVLVHTGENFRTYGRAFSYIQECKIIHTEAQNPVFVSLIHTINYTFIDAVTRRMGVCFFNPPNAAIKCGTKHNLYTI